MSKLLAVLVLIIGFVALASLGGAGHTHELIHCATSGEANPLCEGQPENAVVQDGSPLRSNEGRSMIAGGDMLTCIDLNSNRAWIHCRMIDTQSGDIVSCTDQAQSDQYGCIKSGVGTRRYDIHQNGYKHRGSSHVYWNPKRSVH